MIHVVTIHNQHYYGRQLDEMFRMRHEFYVEGHGWSDLTSDNGRETDDFDNEDAIYLISIDRRGGVAAALRLNPTIGPNLTARLSHFVDGDAPNSPEIWDMTRWIVAARYRGAPIAGRIMPGQELGCGLMEFALKRGVSHFSMIAESGLIYKLDAVGWRYHAIGPTTSYEDGKGTAQALLLETSPEALMQVRALLGVHEDVLFELTPPPMIALEDEPPPLETHIASEMARVGRLAAIRTVQRLTDRLADAIEDDPAAAIEAIMTYSDQLMKDLAETADQGDERAFDTKRSEAS